MEDKAKKELVDAILCIGFHDIADNSHFLYSEIPGYDWGPDEVDEDPDVVMEIVRAVRERLAEIGKSLGLDL